ncbi:MAG: hypothetical protein LRZ84_05230 [Desertifilum sp.]|nr:hypothetical protein [Desertifilum sp.]
MIPNFQEDFLIQALAWFFLAIAPMHKIWFFATPVAVLIPQLRSRQAVRFARLDSLSFVSEY